MVFIDSFWYPSLCMKQTLSRFSSIGFGFCFSCGTHRPCLYFNRWNSGSLVSTLSVPFSESERKRKRQGGLFSGPWIPGMLPTLRERDNISQGLCEKVSLVQISPSPFPQLHHPEHLFLNVFKLNAIGASCEPQVQGRGCNSAHWFHSQWPPCNISRKVLLHGASSKSLCVEEPLRAWICRWIPRGRQGVIHSTDRSLLH